jgi:hypothetical protein
MLDGQGGLLQTRTASQAAEQLKAVRVVERIRPRCASVSQLQHRVLEIAARCSSAREPVDWTGWRSQAGVDETRYMADLLEDMLVLDKLANNATEDSLEDMLALDNLSGLASEDRASRKVAIAVLEETTEALDEVKAHLRSLHGVMKEVLAKASRTSSNFLAQDYKKVEDCMAGRTLLKNAASLSKSATTQCLKHEPSQPQKGTAKLASSTARFAKRAFLQPQSRLMLGPRVRFPRSRSSCIL